MHLGGITIVDQIGAVLFIGGSIYAVIVLIRTIKEELL